MGTIKLESMLIKKNLPPTYIFLSLSLMIIIWKLARHCPENSSTEKVSTAPDSWELL